MESTMTSAMVEYFEDIKYCINEVEFDTTKYIELQLSDLGIKGDASNKIYTIDGVLPRDFVINYDAKAKGSKIFIGAGVRCKGSRVNVRSEGNILYIGKGTSLNNVSISILCRGDFVMVGEGVSVTSSNNWSTGFKSWEK